MWCKKSNWFFSAPVSVGAGTGAFVLPPIPQIANLVEWSFPRNICFSTGGRVADIAFGW
jgi:hypothetical protein